MSEHVKLVIERLPFYRLPVAILLALTMIFMSEKEQANLASRFTGFTTDDLYSSQFLQELHKKVKSDLADYALQYLNMSSIDLIDDIFSRVKTLTESNSFYRATMMNSADANQCNLPLLPSNWKRQLIAYLLPAVTMDKHLSAIENNRR